MSTHVPGFQPFFSFLHLFVLVKLDTQRELSTEYQVEHDRVSMVFKSLCIHVLWRKVALALDL